MSSKSKTIKAVVSTKKLLEDVEFIDFRRPKLPAGNYNVAITQETWADSSDPKHQIVMDLAGFRLVLKAEIAPRNLPEPLKM